MYKQGASRNQTLLFPPTLEELISEDNPVRVIDVFIDTLNLKQLGFSKTILASTGCSPYDPGMLLKLYIYGYMNRIRTSRKLERECIRNIEVMCLRTIVLRHTGVADRETNAKIPWHKRFSKRASKTIKVGIQAIYGIMLQLGLNRETTGSHRWE
jgi:hypothetical protein